MLSFGLSFAGFPSSPSLFHDLASCPFPLVPLSCFGCMVSLVVCGYGRPARNPKDVRFNAYRQKIRPADSARRMGMIPVIGLSVRSPVFLRFLVSFLFHYFPLPSSCSFLFLTSLFLVSPPLPLFLFSSSQLQLSPSSFGLFRSPLLISTFSHHSLPFPRSSVSALCSLCPFLVLSLSSLLASPFSALPSLFSPHGFTLPLPLRAGI